MEFDLSFDYIHAERLTENISDKVNMNIQLSFPSSPPKVEDGKLEARFIVNITSQPPLLALTLKGVLRMTGSREEVEEARKRLESGETDPALFHLLASYIIFETALLAKELGLPPAIPLLPTHMGGEPGFNPV